MTELYKYRKRITIEAKAKDKMIEQLDLKHQIQILENELYHRYLNLILPKEELIQHGIYLKKEPSNMYQMDILIQNQKYRIEGEIHTEQNQCKIMTLRLVSSDGMFRSEVDHKSTQHENLVEVPKPSEQVQPPSNPTESLELVDNPKESKAVIKLWMDIVNQKSTFLSFKRTGDWNVLSYSEYTSLDSEEKEYPLLYQLDGQYIRVVFEDGESDDFLTEFCAKVYAVLKPTDLKVLSDIRNLDRMPEANEKILRFVDTIAQSENSEHLEILSRLKIKSLQKSLVKEEKNEESKGGIFGFSVKK